MKRITALLCAALLCLSVLAGCGSRDADAAKPIEANYGISDEEITAIRERYGTGWYGWMWVSEADGRFADYANSSVDVCGRFAFDDAALSPVAFVSVYQAENPSTVCAAFTAQISSDEDWSLAGAQVLGEDAQPGDTMQHEFINDYPDLLAISGKFQRDDGSFTYQISLRPWGARWDDVASSMPENLPQLYESWYLPMIDAGTPMP